MSTLLAKIQIHPGKETEFEDLMAFMYQTVMRLIQTQDLNKTRTHLINSLSYQMTEEHLYRFHQQELKSVKE